MISPKATEAAGDKFGLHPVCAGPFSFDSRVAQDRIVLKRFPGYWDAKSIHFDQVVYLPNPNSSVRLANLQAGALDIVEYILPTDVPAVQKDPKLKTAIDDSLAYTGITINTDNGSAQETTLGKNALVRQAFELAIDREALIQVVYIGHVYADGRRPIRRARRSTSQDLKVPARDVAKAKALLKQAGVPMPVPVTLTITNGSDIQQAGEVIQSMASEAGFDVKIKAMEFASSLQAAYAGDFQAYLIGWSGRADPDGNMWQMLHTGGTFNYGHYSNAGCGQGAGRCADGRRGRSAACVLRQGVGAGAQGPAADLSVDRQEHRRDEEGADRVPAGAGRADPAAGDGDEVTSGRRSAAGIYARGNRTTNRAPSTLLPMPAPVLGRNPPAQRLDDLPADRQAQPRVLAELLALSAARNRTGRRSARGCPRECPALRPRR